MTGEELSIRPVDGVCVVTLTGDVDTAVAGRIEAEIVARVDPTAALVVDLAGVLFLDSAGVRLLDRLVGRHAGAPVVIVAPNGSAPWYTLRMCEFPLESLAGSVRAAITAVGTRGG